MKRRILSFENFLLESDAFNTMNVQVDLSAISSSELQSIIDMDMKSYLKKAMWNKSIEVFYGKDYKGNPTEDKREILISGVLSGTEKHTMGEFFQEAWKETDQFCDRAVEYGMNISETWRKICANVLWNPLGIVIGSYLATTGIAPSLASIILSKIARTDTNPSKSWNISIGILGGLSGVSLHVSTEMKSNKYSNLSPELNKIADMIEDKEGTIKNFKTQIENKSDFEADWGLDNWLSSIQVMPGWNKSSWAKTGVENIGYSFTYWISYYAYQYLKIKFGATIVQSIKEISSKP